MRIALHSTIIDGMVEEYRARHLRVPDDLVDLFARAGITDWTIWRSGGRLFHLVDCEDWEHAMEVVLADPADVRWQQEIGPLVAGFWGPDGAPGTAQLERVWSLSDQRPA